MNPYEVYCGDCKKTILKTDLVESITCASNDVYHIRGECPVCRRWIKWVPYSESKIVRNTIKAVYHNDHDELEKIHLLSVIKEESCE